VNVTTPDGRTLRVHVGGDEHGMPVLAHHGTPSSGILYAPWEEDAQARGICLIGYDRPGYGGSTRHAGRTVGDAAADVRAIAAALGIERLATWGISGGGPHALACAALAPDLVAAAASIAGVMPYGADGVDYLEGMGEANVAEFGAVLEGEETLRPLLERDAVAMRDGGPEGVKETLATLLSPVDETALAGMGDFLHETMELGLRPGVDGWLDDNLAFVADWGFDPASIEIPVLLLHGVEDRFVPATHFEWLAGRIPAAEARLEPAHGHLSLAEELVGEVLGWLVQDRSVTRRS
jgi:pimeloyl-ACP methyl ester carboxylesterase